MKNKKSSKKQPRYRIVVKDMIERIESGEWSKGEAIPAINRLEKVYPVSRMTVLNAMHILEEEGYVSVEHGRGTIVRRELPGKRIGILCGSDIFNVPAPMFRSALVNLLREKLKDEGYLANFYVAQDYMMKDTPYPNPSLSLDVRRKHLKGLILLGTDTMPELCQDAGEKNLPVVGLTESKFAPAIVGLNWDHFVKESIQFFANRGKKNMMFIVSAEDQLKALDDLRSSGKLGDLRIHDYFYDCTAPDSSSEKSFTNLVEEEGFRWFDELASNDIAYDAIIVGDDIFGKGLLQAYLKTSNLKLSGQDILVEGNTAVPLFYPIQVHRYLFDTSKLATLTINKLLSQIDGQSILSPVEFVQGEIIKLKQ